LAIQNQGFISVNDRSFTRLPINTWLSKLDSTANGDRGSSLLDRLRISYGAASDSLGKVISNCRQLLRQAGEQWGLEAEVGILRSPGRVNLMGRHVDHQGGHCNLMAIDREILMVFRPREDSEFHLWNLDDKAFPRQSFSVKDFVGRADLIQQQAASGNKTARWGIYFQAAALRLQEKFSERQIFGLDAVVTGDIPMGAGLSSSSALVVACAETLVRTNNLPLSGEELVDECGEGEKYVGTRGGSADHAAIRLSQPGHILQVTFFPFGIERCVAFPESLCTMVCHSGEEAHKAIGARDIFNSRVAAYAMARELIRHSFPEIASRVQHLRDINEKNLGVPLPEIYRMLAFLPERMDRASFLDRVSPEVGEKIDEDLFMAHHEPEEGYPVRGVGLYGLAECQRSARFADLLERGDAEAIGEQMLISHQSERFVRHDEALRPTPARHATGDGLFEELVTKAEAGDPAAALWRQPGYYQCSTPGIDLLVDAAMGIPGVYGAQLAGAGLGGCMMVLVENSAVAQLRQRLLETYYEPKGITPQMIPCRPVRGCECL
jgi:N-acetylgalactosamine kinase